MDGTEHEERRRRLQRIVYGADASPDERAAAEAELQELADAAASAGAAAGVPVDRAADGIRAAAVADHHEHADAAEPPTGRTSPPTARWAIVGGTAALVVGIAIGVGVSGLTAAPAEPVVAGTSDAIGGGSQPDTSAEGSVITGPGTPVELTPVYEVFAREQRPSDTVADDVLAGSELDGASTRLLMTRSDGAELFAATQGGGEDMCIVVAMPELGAGSACTDGGILPPEGLTVSFGFDQTLVIAASLHADGTAGLNAAEEPAAE